MKKIYTLAFCCVLGVGCVGASPRFAAQKKADAGFSPIKISSMLNGSTEINGKKLVVRKPSGEIFRPAYSVDYLWEDGAWMQMGTMNYKYDSRGLETEVHFVFEDEEMKEETLTVNEYNENGMLVKTVGSYIEDGEAIDDSRKSFVYDDVVNDYWVERIGEDYNGSEWVSNYYSTKRKITRNADGNIQEWQMSLNSGGEWIPTYKQEWEYGEDGKAEKFYHYQSDVFSANPSWSLYDNTYYTDIVWQDTDGQMLGDGMMSFVVGNNRAKSYTVYYKDRIDGYAWVDYVDWQPGSYTIYESFLDKSQIGRMTMVQDFSANPYGFIRYTRHIYVDDDGNCTYPDPTYTVIHMYSFDEYKNLIEDMIFEDVCDGEGLIQVAGARYEYEYDDNGNISEMVALDYDPEIEAYENVSKTVYCEYSDVSSSISAIEARDSDVNYSFDNGVLVVNCTAMTGVSVYSVSGACVARAAGIESVSLDLNALASGLYIVKVEGTPVSMRIVK